MRRALGLTPLGWLLLGSDVLLVGVGLWLSTVVRLALPYGQAISASGAALPWVVFAMAEACWILSLFASGAYDQRRILRWYHEAGRVLAGAAIGTIVLAGMLYFSFREVSRLQFLYFFALSLGLILGARAALRLYHRIVRRTRPGWRNRVVIVGAGELGQRAARILIGQSRWGYSLIGFLDDDPDKIGKSFAGHTVLGPLDQIGELSASAAVDEVWICLPGRAFDRVEWVVGELERHPLQVRIAPDYFSLALVNARAEVIGGIPFIGLRESVIDPSARVVKRIFDILGSLAMLAILAIPMAVVALVIRLDSPGPVFFRQRRVGENGKLFDMLKFRTMVAEAEQLQAQVLTRTEEGQVIHKKKDDPRVTRVGRWLRRYSVDELPQLWNVHRGEMSLVGPRPELPWLVDRYEGWQRKRFAVPQGLTGWWQVSGRSDRPMHLSTEDDLYYVFNYSIWLDLRILLMTPIAVLGGRGAF